MAMDLGAVSARIEIDDSKAAAALESAQKALESLEQLRPEVTVDADATQAERKLGAVQSFLAGVLDGMQAEVSVDGDTGRAEAAMKFVEGMLDGLEGEKSTIEVDADTSEAEQGLDSVADKAASAGDDAGDRMGEGMVAGILAGLASIPIAGAVVKIGQAVAEGLFGAIQDGLAVEASQDLFSARTGLDAETARTFAHAAGQAYAQGFGESMEGNLETARDALQAGLIDTDATGQQIATVVGQLESLSLVAEEEADAISLALSRMVESGLADDMENAMDVLVRGFQTGADAAADLLDTFTEYSAAFSGLGLSAEQSLGLLNQGLEAGVRNTDVIADAFNEFGIRMREGTDDAREALEGMGLDAQAMFDAIAAGGPAAAEATDKVLDALRAIEDPIARNQAGVALFGTMWEDTAGKLGALDPSSAVSALGEIEGAMGSMMDTLADSPAAALERAQREVEVAWRGVLETLAVALDEPLTALSDWVSGNQAGVMQFFGSVANGFFDMAGAAVDGAAIMVEALAAIPASMADVLRDLEGTLVIYNELAKMDPTGMFPEIPESAISSLSALRQGLEAPGEAAEATQEKLGWLSDRLDELQGKFNQEYGPLIDEAAFSDALARVNEVVLAIDDAGGTISVDLSTADADATLGELIGDVDAATGTVTIDGTAVPAELTVSQLVSLISGTAESVTIGGESYTAEQVLGELLGRIRVSGDSVWIGANADDAYNVLRGFLNSIPTSVSVAIRGIPVLGAVGSALSALGNADGGPVEMAGGGPVVGPGGPRDDLIPAVNVDTGQAYALSNGEHVLDAQDVLNLGGHEGVYALRALAERGLVRPLEAGLASGGPVGSSSTLAAPAFPSTLVLRVGEREFTAYVEGIAQDTTGRALDRAVGRTR